jgi:hypothetical protein
MWRRVITHELEEETIRDSRQLDCALGKSRLKWNVTVTSRASLCVTALESVRKCDRSWGDGLERYLYIHEVDYYRRFELAEIWDVICKL